MLRSIVTNIEKLRLLSSPVGPGDPIIEIANDMWDTWKAHSTKGIGLAAPQIGILKRVVIVGGEGHSLRMVINPRITSQKGTQISEEGCLSLPWLTTLIDVPRADKIRLRGTDIATGGPIKLFLRGLDAAVAQHEVDHLDGKLIIDYKEAR